MKPGIILVSAAALALTVFAAPEAHGWWHPGPDLTLRASGSNFITSSEDGRPTPQGQVSTSMQSGIAKGRYGRAIFTAQTVIEETLPDSRCPMDLPFGNDLSTTIVFTYNDGSILSVATGPESFYCSDGTVFEVDFLGVVTGGERRFKGASGTWTGTARAEGGRVTSRIEIDLD